MAVRIARWCFTLLGGALLGIGLVLHGQLMIAWQMIGRVDDTFFLWRQVGRATFFLQGSDVRVALALKEIPPAALEECNRAATMMVIVGTLLAITAPLLRVSPKAPRAAKAAKASRPAKAVKAAPRKAAA